MNKRALGSVAPPFLQPHQSVARLRDFSRSLFFDDKIFLLYQPIIFLVANFACCTKASRLFASRDRRLLIATLDLSFATLFCAKTLWPHKRQADGIR